MLAGLRGREIGMFFAARSRAKKERQEIEMVCEEFLHYFGSLWIMVITISSKYMY